MAGGKDYKVVKGASPDEIASAVRSALEQGWKLQGGVSITNSTSSHKTYYAQAVVRRRRK